MQPINLIFDRFFVYELRPDIPLPFQHIVCLSTTELNYRHEVKAISFLPIVAAGPYANHDPYRVPLVPRSAGGGVRIPRRMYVAIDAIQSIGKGVFMPTHLGRVTPVEEAEIRNKLSNWLGLSADAERSEISAAKKSPPEGRA